MLKDVDAEVGLGVEILVDHPVGRRHTFLPASDLPASAAKVRVNRRGGKGFARATGGSTTIPVERANHRSKQTQTLVGIVIAVEEQPGVGRMSWRW